MYSGALRVRKTTEGFLARVVKVIVGVIGILEPAALPSLVFDGCFDGFGALPLILVVVGKVVSSPASPVSVGNSSAVVSECPGGLGPTEVHGGRGEVHPGGLVVVGWPGSEWVGSSQ